MRSSAVLALLLVNPYGLLLAENPAGVTAHQPSRLDFPTRILPILTKTGCNAGACHGAAIGQGGFKLSLLGYDPEQDYDTITRELASRRINLDHPSESLLLRKPTRELHHKGGLRIKKDSDDYQTLVAWINSGAPYGPSDLGVRSIQVTPSDVLAERPSQ